MDGVLMSDRPVLDPGEIVCSSDGTYAFRIVEHIGEGRCCLVYSAKSIRDSKTKVALKVLTRSVVKSFDINFSVGQGLSSTIKSSDFSFCLSFFLVYKRGPTYAGAIQREQYILDCLSEPQNNLVMCYGSFVFNGLHIQVLRIDYFKELIDILDTVNFRPTFRSLSQGEAFALFYP